MTENTYLAYGECYQVMPRAAVQQPMLMGFDMANGGDMSAVIEYRKVTIPARDQHEGCEQLTVTLPWVCLVCGGPRGEPFETLSFDGSRKLAVNGWTNQCGHIEKYSQVRAALAVMAKQEG